MRGIHMGLVLMIVVITAYKYATRRRYAVCILRR